MSIVQRVGCSTSYRIYSAHCEALNGPDAIRSHIATTYGVTKNSILNSYKYFHVVRGLVPDIMHDILEG